MTDGKISAAARATAKRTRECARCQTKISGSEVGMGYAECITCRLSQREREKPAQPNTAEQPPRARARDELVAARKRRFLKLFAQSANISRAARAAKVGRTQVYAWLEFDETFGIAMQQAREEAFDVLEEEAVQRAMGGSDTLLMFLLRANRPERFRERAEIKHVAGDSGAQLTTEELEAVRRALTE